MLGRPEEARSVLDAGIVIAGDQELPYDEALLRRERTALAADLGDAQTADADAARAALLFAELGALAS